MSEHHVRIAADLYRCRDAARTLLGEKFTDAMRANGCVLKAMAEHQEKDILVVAIESARAAPDGYVAVLLLAAAVEMLEPSSDSAA